VREVKERADLLAGC